MKIIKDESGMPMGAYEVTKTDLIKLLQASVPASTMGLLEAKNAVEKWLAEESVPYHVRVTVRELRETAVREGVSLAVIRQMLV